MGWPETFKTRLCQTTSEQGDAQAWISLPLAGAPSNASLAFVAWRSWAYVTQANPVERPERSN